MTTQEKLDALEQAGYLVWNPRARTPRIKRYINPHGKPIQDIITDIHLISISRERIGFPTQKPLALLQRIIHASSNEGDTVLDPFCGSGTTLVAALQLNRRAIGIDASPHAVALAHQRLTQLK